jgi:hypothetical protein
VSHPAAILLVLALAVVVVLTLRVFALFRRRS